MTITVMESRRTKKLVEVANVVKTFKTDAEVDLYLEKRIEELKGENFVQLEGGLKSFIRLENGEEVIFLEIDYIF